MIKKRDNVAMQIIIVAVLVVLLALLGFLGVFNSFTGNVVLQGETSSADRILPSSYLPGTTIVVNISVNFDPADCGGAVVETVPLGWNVSVISGDGSGVFNPSDNKVRWAPIDGPLCGGVSNHILGYFVTPNATQSGTKTFNGTFSADGTSYQIGGSINITQQVNAPSNLRITSTNQTSISLAWNAVSGATSYNVYRSTTSGGTYSVVASPSTNLSVDSGLTAGTTYYYKVSTVISGQESNQTGFVNGTTSNKLNPSLTISILPNSTVIQGQSLTNVTGTGCPGGLNCSLYRNGPLVSNPDFQNLSAGNYTYIYNTSGNAIYNPASVSSILTVNPAFNFTLSSNGTKNVSQGSSVVQIINLTLISGNTQTVNLTASNLSSGVNASFSLTSCNPGCISLLNLSANSSATLGTRAVMVFAASGSLNRTIQFSLIVNQPAPAQPSGLTATVISQNQINLNWSFVSGATSYNIYRSTIQGAEVYLRNTTTNSYSNATLASGTTYYFKVSAVGPGGESDLSSEVNATTPNNNTAPNVSAGIDQTIILPANASLSGVVSDDGLPLGSTLTFNWSKVIGPGSVAFRNASNLSTTASFSVNGTYVLTLRASDGNLSSNDNVTLTVVNPPCLLTSAVWSMTSASEGQQVYLTVNGSYCSGETVNFVVWEDDVFGDSTDDAVVTNPGSAVFSNNTATATWISEFQDDGFFGGNPEYYFISTQASNLTNTLRSSNEVIVKASAIDYHAADIDNDWVINLSEYGTYNLYFKQALDWPGTSSPPSIDYYTRALYLFRVGQSYSYNFSGSCTLPICWVSAQ